MIEKILPSYVACAEAFDDAVPVTLFPQEETAVARAVHKRRREFGTTRLCARRALANLGIPAVPVPPGVDGAPRWPNGVVGSMTHCDGYRAAALARATKLRSLGIDAEPHAALPDGVLDTIALPQERRRLAALSADRRQTHWARLLFSAKESVYKAWYPLAGRWLGFEDADITIEPEQGTFSVRLLVPGPELDGNTLAGFAGRWLIQDGLIVTAVAVDASRPAATVAYYG